MRRARTILGGAASSRSARCLLAWHAAHIIGFYYTYRASFTIHIGRDQCKLWDTPVLIEDATPDVVFPVERETRGGLVVSSDTRQMLTLEVSDAARADHPGWRSLVPPRAQPPGVARCGPRNRVLHIGHYKTL